MTVSTYPKYKMSNIGFLGDVPAPWRLERLKHCAEVFPSNVDKKSVEGQVLVKLCNYTDVYYNGTISGELDFMPATATREQVKRFELQQGDVVFTKDSESADDIGVAALVPRKVPGVIYGYHLSIARAKESVLGAFLKKYFDSEETKAYFAISANGLTRVGLGQYAVDNAPIALPSLGEQAQIVRFLDHETAKIDALTQEQKRLIELLKEKRQAVISHAVSKGLDPNVTMKDSGVEWLGEVPAHWTVSKVKHVAVVSGGYAFSSNEFSEYGVQLIRIGNLYQSKLQLDRDPIYIPETRRGKYRAFEVKRGDLLMSLTGTLGKRDYGFAVMYDVDGPSLLNQRVAKITPLAETMDPYFLLLLLQSEDYLNHIYSLPSGTKQANLSNSDVLSPWISFPPCLLEQSEIVNRVSQLTSRLDQLITTAVAAISLLHERRSALISAAVTGKIDVRNWQPPADESAFDEEVRQAGMEAAV
jgi:type I restriction enzyme S subunit